MDSSTVVGVLIVLSLACLQSTAETTDASVIFIDSSTHQHLRQTSQTTSMSAMEVGAAVSVLLGLAPPPMLSSESSSKLNELLSPNPFARPRHVFMLEVALAEDSQPTVHSDNDVVGSSIKRKLISSSASSAIELPGTEEVSFFSLDGSDLDHTAVTDKEISDFAQSFGGSYILSNSEPQNGVLIIPLPSGFKLNLHMSKKADRRFATGLMYIIEKTKKAMEMKQDLPESNFDSAELMAGCFDGIKAMQEEYGSNVDIAEQAMDLLLFTVSKLFDSLQEKYRGEIVAVVLFSNAHSTQPHRVLEVTFASRPSPRLLEEDAKTSSRPIIIAELALVRITLAWFTGIVLIIATLIGVYLLVNMPVTRDTLLYSNVKLD